MCRVALAGVLTMACLFPNQPARADQESTDRAKAFVAEHVKTVRPLEVAANLAWWNANTTGKDEDFQKKEEAQNRIDNVLSDKDRFAEIKAVKSLADQGKIDDAVLARVVQVLYLEYLGKQVEPALLKQITAKENAVEQKFNTFRAQVAGKPMADSEVRSVLVNSKDSKLRQEVWEASKKVGSEVEADLKQLVRLRNQAAKQLGFANFHAMMLFLNEQDGEELIALFDELDRLTRGPFTEAKKEIDQKLSDQFSVPVDRLMPWHYHDPFFQESPSVFAVDLNAPYLKADILQLCSKFYAGVGLPIDDVIARSDLYEKPGKSPHAFCTDIDREGDVRVLANIVPNEYWAGTMLHELGHAVYSSKYIPETVPYPVRDAAHILTTEGVAMQFERFSKSRRWLERMGVHLENPEEYEKAAAKVQRNQLLIFSRWCQVMLRFEKLMYENPDQDLNKLWWDLVEEYQALKRPADRNAPDYASKIHICSAPVYYHNYMMGQLFASQVHHAIARQLYKDADPAEVTYADDKRVGEFMREKVFRPGRTMDWKQLTEHATGEGLNAKAFAKDFQK